MSYLHLFLLGFIAHCFIQGAIGKAVDNNYPPLQEQPPLRECFSKVEQPDSIELITTVPPARKQFFHPHTPIMTVSRQESIKVHHGLLDMPRLGILTGTPREYTFYVTAYITGPVQPKTGMVVDLLDFIQQMRRVLHLPPLQIPVPEKEQRATTPRNSDASISAAEPRVNGGETHSFLDLIDDDNIHRVPATAEHFCLWFYRQMHPWVTQTSRDITLSKVTVTSSQNVSTTCIGNH